MQKSLPDMATNENKPLTIFSSCAMCLLNTPAWTSLPKAWKWSPVTICQKEHHARSSTSCNVNRYPIYMFHSWLHVVYHKSGSHHALAVMHKQLACQEIRLDGKYSQLCSLTFNRLLFIGFQKQGTTFTCRSFMPSKTLISKMKESNKEVYSYVSIYVSIVRQGQKEETLQDSRTSCGVKILSCECNPRPCVTLCRGE